MSETFHAVTNQYRATPDVVVFGTGSIGMRHARIFRDLVGARTILVSKRRGRWAELEADGWDTCSSLEQAVTPGALVVVAGETANHVADGIAAIESGAGAVLIEKPLAPDAAAAALLNNAANEIAGRLYVGCNLRFDAGIQRFRQLLQQIGVVDHVRIEAQSYLPEWRPLRDYRDSYSASGEQGGVLRDLVHEIDYAVWLFGRPQEVSGWLTNSGRLEILAEESADVVWRMPEGGTVSLRLDYVTRQCRRRMTAYGAEGELTWDMPTHVVSLRKDELALSEECPQERDEMMRSQALAFLSSARGEGAGALATLEEGVFVMAVCDAARASSSSGSAERVSAFLEEAKR
jgi:predicted dehydrogenase